MTGRAVVELGKAYRLIAEVDPAFMDDGHLCPEMARTLHHLGSGRFAVADRLLVIPKERI